MNNLTIELDELIALIAKHLVDRPDKVQIRTVKGDRAMVLELRVAREDLGKVIGKQGRTVNAMRTLMGAAASKIKKHTILEIVE